MTLRSNSPRPDLSKSGVMTDAEALELMASDPDATPTLSTDPPRRWYRSPFTRELRRKLKLTQEAFSARYGIPVSTIRDWEQHRYEPQPLAMSYLLVIAGDPEGTARAYAEGQAKLAVTAE